MKTFKVLVVTFLLSCCLGLGGISAWLTLWMVYGSIRATWHEIAVRPQRQFDEAQVEVLVERNRDKFPRISYNLSRGVDLVIRTRRQHGVTWEHAMLATESYMRANGFPRYGSD